jgi:hypothetical protein
LREESRRSELEAREAFLFQRESKILGAEAPTALCGRIGDIDEAIEYVHFAHAMPIDLNIEEGVPAVRSWFYHYETSVWLDQDLTFLFVSCAQSSSRVFQRIDPK